MTNSALNLPVDSSEMSKEIFLKQQQEYFPKLHRIFSILLAAECIVAIVIAFAWTSRTWVAVEIPNYLSIAILASLASALIPIGLMTMKPFAPVTFHAIAVGQMLFSSIFIFLSGGRIEAHFHIFASLAFLSVYHDWKILLTGTLVVVADHLLRGILLPMSIFCVREPSFLRALEHGGYVVFEDVILVWSCVLALRNRHEQADILADSREKTITLHRTQEEYRKSQEIIHQREQNSIENLQKHQQYLEESAGHILQALQRFALGDLTVRVSADSTETFGKIYAGFNTSIHSVARLVQELSTNISQTAKVASILNSASEQMAATSQEQAAQITQLASAAEEMSRSVNEAAHNADKVNDIMVRTGNGAEQGAQVVQTAMSKMQEIAQVVTNASAVVEKLGSSSAEIGAIVQVIDEIADQTNLLALNAAIEAARAGDQGRGFAVVADEVRKLAERTAQATKQISQTIQQIQRDTAQAVDGIKKGDSEVQAGVTLAQQAGTALENIVNNTYQATMMVQATANAIRQQASSSEEIAKSVEHLSVAAQETSTTLTDVARSSEHLHDLTGTLQDLVGGFTVHHEQVPLKKQPIIGNKLLHS